MPGDSLVCPRCLCQVNDRWPFCTHCGSRLGITNAPATTFPLCENCGALVELTGAFCWHCGVPLATGHTPHLPTPKVWEDVATPREDSVASYAASSARSKPPALSGNPKAPSPVTAIPWWRRPLITRETEPRIAYSIGVTMGASITIIICALTSLGALLSKFYQTNLGYPLWGLSGGEAGVLLVIVISISWIVAGLMLWYERRKDGRAQTVAPPSGSL